MCPVLLQNSYTPIKLKKFSLMLKIEKKVDKAYSLSSKNSQFSKYYL